MIYKYQGIEPKIADSAFIAPSSDIIGKVTIGEGSSIWFQTVLRGDEDTITIGKNTNIQDGSTIHNANNKPVVVGDHVTVGHQVLLHGCTIGDYTLVGMGATVLDGAEVGEFTIIGANSLVTQNKKIPSGVLALGSPVKVIRELTEEEKNKLKISANRYLERGREYNTDLG